MALKKCSECKKTVSSKAIACPSCGAPVKKQSRSSGCLGVLVILLGCTVYLAVQFSNTESSPSRSQPKQTYRTPAEPHSALPSTLEVAPIVDQPSIADIPTELELPTHTPAGPELTSELKPPKTSTTKATIRWCRLVPYRIPGNKQRLQMAMTKWVNTGATPIRTIDGRFTFFDKKKKVIASHDYTVYATSDGEPGIAPGEVYVTPKGEGFVLDPEHLAASVELEILKVLEHSGF